MPESAIQSLPAGAYRVEVSATGFNALPEDTQYTTIIGDIQSAEEAHNRWANRLDLYLRLRLRIRKTKTFPFPGASNLRMPTGDKWLRKVVAARLQQFWGIRPHAMVTAISEAGQDVAPRIERLLDWQVEEQIPNALQTVTLAADKTAEQGFAFVSPIWHMEDQAVQVELAVGDLQPREVTELFGASASLGDMMQWLLTYWEVDLSETVVADNLEEIARAATALARGAERVTASLRDELYNGPLWRFFPAEYVLAPADGPLDPQQNRWIAFERYESLEVLRRMAARGQIESDPLEWVQVSALIDQRKLTSIDKDLREGIIRAQNPSHQVKLYEWYGWLEVEPGVLEKRYALLAPDFRVFLKRPIALPFEHGQFPVVRFNNEVMDDRWHSPRGWMELLEDIIKEIDTQHNQKLDQQTIRNAPMFAFRSGVVNPRLVRFVPAQAIPVPGGTPLNDAVQLLNNTNLNAEFSYEREEMLLKTEIQELVGQVDYSLQSTINRRNPRTAQEVAQAAAASGIVATLDSMHWGLSLSQLLTQTFQLDQQYLPERVYLRVAGERPDVPPLRLRREEIQGKFLVHARGNDQNTNVATRAAQSANRIALLATPLNVRMGLVNPQNIYNLYKRWLQDQGEVGWEQYLSVPPPPPQPAPPPAITLVKPKYEELTPLEQMQVLASGGIRPDVRGRALRQEQEVVRLHPEGGGNGRPVATRPRLPAGR